MREWWQALQVREQLLLVCVVLIALFVLIDTLIIDTYRVNRQQLVEQVEQAREDLDWMQSSVGRLSSVESNAAVRFTGRIVSFVDQQIQRQGLKQNLLQMTPVQEHSVRVRLRDVGFSRLLDFLAAVDGAVQVDEVRILPADATALVNATLVISKPGKGL